MLDDVGDMIWTGLIFTGLGLAFLAGGFWSWLSGRDFHRAAVRTRGTVIDLRVMRGTGSSTGMGQTGGMGDTGGMSGSGRTGTTYAPVLAFRTHAGQDVKTVSWASQSPPVAQTGEVVEVLYDPRDPSSAIVDKPGARGGVVTVAAFAGGALGVVIGLVILLG